MRQAKVKAHHPTTLLALIAFGVLVAGLLALVSAKPAWAAPGPSNRLRTALLRWDLPPPP
jgi:hypothetical protein